MPDKPEMHYPWIVNTLGHQLTNSRGEPVEASAAELIELAELAKRMRENAQDIVSAEHFVGGCELCNEGADQDRSATRGAH